MLHTTPTPVTHHDTHPTNSRDRYVHCNPQLEALAERGVNSVDAAQGMTR
jgi:hypothetical protein